MAADVTQAAGASPAPAPAPSQPPAPPKLRPYRGRFVFVYLALAAALGAGAAGLVLALGGVSVGGGSAAWAPWQPTAGGDRARAKEIATHFAAGYRLPTGDQLLDVLVKAPSVQGVPIRAVAVRGSGGEGDRIEEVDSGNSVMFVLCGLGPGCSIAKGQASIARGRLVRREALQLALYTFKYASAFKHIIAFMPPRKGAQPQYVVYFTRADLADQLEHPLGQTLGARTPRQDRITPRETATIDRLTEPHMFKFQFQQAQQGDAILILDPAL